MVNLQIRQFRENIIKEINTSQIPIEIKRLVISEIMKQLEEVADKEINRELELAKAAENKKEDGTDEQGIQSNKLGE